MLDKAVISPRANVKYNIVKDLQWRISYSSGFRAPQTFDEDLHISFLNNEGIFTRNAIGLKPENSNSLSSSFDYYLNIENVQSNILVEGFYTQINNVFVLVQTEDEAGNAIKERRNGHKANVMGINMEGKIAPSRSVQFQFGYTLQKSFYSEAQNWADDEGITPEKRMLRTPNHYGYFSLTVEPWKRLMISATGTYTGSILVPHFAGYIDETRLEKTPQFFDAGLKASYNFKLRSIDLQLSGGMKNIFNSYQKNADKGAHRVAGYVYGPALHRTGFLSLKISNIGW